MMVHLIVIRPFLQYGKGDVIVHADQIHSILASDHRAFVVKVGASGQAEG